MNKTMKAMAAIMLMMVFAVGCNKPDEPNNGGNSGGGNNGNYDSDVRVTTYTPQHISQASAVCGGDVIVVQGLSLNRLGVCWSKNPDPTVEDAHLSTKKWAEPYVCTITGLEIGTTYYVRAFALRGLEYYYGENKSFTTEYSHVSEVNVTTYTPQDITQTSVVCGGEVRVADGLSLNRIGVCWSKEPNPTIENTGLSTVNCGEPYFCTITRLEPGITYHVRAYALYDAECFYGEDKSFTTESSSGSYNGHDYADLDLPSGTLWATCNVGANAPWEYGDYFAWGEIQPKNYYWWNTYQYCNNGDNHQLTKYCTDSDYGYNGYVDDITILLPEDDVAVANWGGEWFTPTKEQCEELYNNTTSIMTTHNGILGCFFIANNGNAIFLPFSGLYYKTEVEDVNKKGICWSNSLDYCKTAKTLSFYNDCYIGNATRSIGLPVRPVCLKKD